MRKRDTVFPRSPCQGISLALSGFVSTLKPITMTMIYLNLMGRYDRHPWPHQNLMDLKCGWTGTDISEIHLLNSEEQFNFLTKSSFNDVLPWLLWCFRFLVLLVSGPYLLFLVLKCSSFSRLDPRNSFNWPLFYVISFVHSALVII